MRSSQPALSVASERAMRLSERISVNGRPPSWRNWCLKKLACRRKAAWLEHRIVSSSALVKGLSRRPFYASEATSHISSFSRDLWRSTRHSLAGPKLANFGLAASRPDLGRVLRSSDKSWVRLDLEGAKMIVEVRR